MIGPAVLTIEIERVNAVQIPHATGEPTLENAQNEVIVIAHQGVAEDLPVVARSSAIEQEHEYPAVAVVEEDRLLVVPSRHDMVKPGSFVARFAHETTVRGRAGAEQRPARLPCTVVAVSLLHLAPDMSPRGSP
jgi:hypothetical protein